MKKIEDFRNAYAAGKNAEGVLRSVWESIRDEEDRVAVEGAINFFRDVTYTEDYLIGLEIQKGLESGAQEELIFGKNERGNQYFHEWLNWYLQDDPTLPKPKM